MADKIEDSIIEQEQFANESKFTDIIRGMSNVLTYTTYPKALSKDLNQICKPRKSLFTKHCRDDPTVFAYHLLGIIPYLYQYLLLEKVKGKKKRIALISSRQLGKTLILAVVALWAAYYNTMPSGLHQETKVIIISKSENQAKKIIYEIKNLINLGDKKFAIRSREYRKDVLSKELAEGQPQTSTQITFNNGSTIKSLSPTDGARGFTADLLIIDEFAYIEEDLFYDVFEPTTSAVDGMIIMASTPSGCQGLGYKIFDPYNERKSNPYARLWIPWWYCENPIQKALIEEKKEQWIEEGKIRNFQQEYEAKFTVSETSFFDATKIDDAVDRDMAEVMEWHSEPCSLGLDYGWKSARTAMTIPSLGSDGIIRVRMTHAYPTDGSDVNLFDDVGKLKERFNIVHIIPDDCSMGYLTNQKMVNKGWPVTLYNFRTDQNAAERNRGYYMLRTAINTGKVRLSNNPEMIKELKMLLEIRKTVNVSIKAPPGQRDDLADSLCMACYPFLIDNDGDGPSIAPLVYEPTEKEKRMRHPRFDMDWFALTGGK